MCPYQAVDDRPPPRNKPGGNTTQLKTVQPLGNGLAGADRATAPNSSIINITYKRYTMDAYEYVCPELDSASRGTNIDDRFTPFHCNTINIDCTTNVTTKNTLAAMSTIPNAA